MISEDYYGFQSFKKRPSGRIYQHRTELSLQKLSLSKSRQKQQQQDRKLEQLRQKYNKMKASNKKQTNQYKTNSKNILFKDINLRLMHYNDYAATPINPDLKRKIQKKALELAEQRIRNETDVGYESRYRISKKQIQDAENMIQRKYYRRNYMGESLQINKDINSARNSNRNSNGNSIKNSIRNQVRNSSNNSLKSSSSLSHRNLRKLKPEQRQSLLLQKNSNIKSKISQNNHQSILKNQSQQSLNQQGSMVLRTQTIKKYKDPQDQPILPILNFQPQHLQVQVQKKHEEQQKQAQNISYVEQIARNMGNGGNLTASNDYQLIKMLMQKAKEEEERKEEERQAQSSSNDGSSAIQGSNTSYVYSNSNTNQSSHTTNTMTVSQANSVATNPNHNTNMPLNTNTNTYTYTNTSNSQSNTFSKIIRNSEDIFRQQNQQKSRNSKQESRISGSSISHIINNGMPFKQKIQENKNYTVNAKTEEKKNSHISNEEDYRREGSQGEREPGSMDGSKKGSTISKGSGISKPQQKRLPVKPENYEQFKNSLIKAAYENSGESSLNFSRSFNRYNLYTPNDQNPSSSLTYDINSNQNPMTLSNPSNAQIFSQHLSNQSVHKNQQQIKSSQIQRSGQSSKISKQQQNKQNTGNNNNLMYSFQMKNDYHEGNSVNVNGYTNTNVNGINMYLNPILSNGNNNNSNANSKVSYNTVSSSQYNGYNNNNNNNKLNSDYYHGPNINNPSLNPSNMKANNGNRYYSDDQHENKGIDSDIYRNGNSYNVDRNSQKSSQSDFVQVLSWHQKDKQPSYIVSNQQIAMEQAVKSLNFKNNNLQSQKQSSISLRSQSNISFNNQPQVYSSPAFQNAQSFRFAQPQFPQQSHLPTFVTPTQKSPSFLLTNSMQSQGLLLLQSYNNDRNQNTPMQRLLSFGDPNNSLSQKTPSLPSLPPQQYQRQKQPYKYQSPSYSPAISSPSSPYSPYSPSFPSVPSVPSSMSSLPSVPIVSAIPIVSTIPLAPSIASIPQFSSPSLPSNPCPSSHSSHSSQSFPQSLPTYNLHKSLLQLRSSQQKNICSLYSMTSLDDTQLMNIMDKVYEHISTENKILDFVIDTQVFYMMKEQRQHFNLCSYFMLRRLSGLKKKLVQDIRDGNKIGNYPGKQILGQQILRYRQDPSMLKLCQFLTQQSTQLQKILQNLYNSNRYLQNVVNSSNNIISSYGSLNNYSNDNIKTNTNTNITTKADHNDHYIKQDMKKISTYLNQELDILANKIDSNLYGGGDGDGSGERKGGVEDSLLKDSINESIIMRAYQVMEVMFLVSATRGRVLKQVETKPLDVEDFPKYFQTYYPLFKETILYFH